MTMTPRTRLACQWFIAAFVPLVFLALFVLMFLGGCSAASGSAHSGGAEVSNKVVEPDVERVKIEVYGEKLPSAAELNALPFGRVERVKK
jgi:hypothetical protein